MRDSINSGKTAIVAHFHATGDQTFVSDDSKTAYQKYQEYLGSHNTGETSSTQVGCYQEYYSHSHSSGCYTVYHTHDSSCYIEVPHYQTHGYHTDDHGGRWGNYCDACDSFLGDGTMCYNRSSHLTCSRDTSPHLTCGKAAGTYYNKNCSYTNGQILEIKIIME